MNPVAIFGVSALMSLVSSAAIAMLYIWPRLRLMTADEAPRCHSSVPHLFLRSIGLSFLVPGVVAPSLPSAFAIPAGYGDFVAGILALIAIVALSKHASWAIAAVWVFNIWGAADLLFALYQGQRTQLEPGALGAAFFIPTAIVPPLLVTHALIFMSLMRRNTQAVA
jgi:hypothetical protein